MQSINIEASLAINYKSVCDNALFTQLDLQYYVATTDV